MTSIIHQETALRAYVYLAGDDVAMMLRFSGDTVGADSLSEWAERLELEPTLDQARGFSPD